VAASMLTFFLSSRRRHTRFSRDWSSDVCSSDLRYLRPNGETVWVRSVARPVRGRDGTVDRLEGIVIDISGMRAMQRQLAASESKFRVLTQMSSDWIWETDAQHRLSWLSDSVDAVLGQWKRRWIGRRRWEGDGLAAESMPADWAQHRQVLDAHKPFENFEISQIGRAHV